MDLSNILHVFIDDIEVKQFKDEDLILWRTMGHRLPAEYQEVEWLQAGNGVKAYLDLGFTFDTAAIVRMGFYCYNNTPSYLFGAAENSGVYRCMISAPYNGTMTAYGYGSNGQSYLGMSTSLQEGFNDLKLSLKAGELTLTTTTTNSSHTSTDQSTYAMSSNLYLFAQNYNGSMRQQSLKKIYYFQYYDKTGNLICDLVPCYRKSDGTLGMYDMIKKTFLTNVGESRFTRGASIGSSYKNWVEYATETATGNAIYNNGKGYKDGYRVRSGGLEATQSDGTCTGFIPYTKGEKLYIYPSFMGLNTTNAINFYDSAGTVLGQITDSGAYYGFCNSSFKTKVVNGGSLLDLSNVTVSGVENVAFVRITNDSDTDILSGSGMIITKNQEI